MDNRNEPRSSLGIAFALLAVALIPLSLSSVGAGFGLGQKVDAAVDAWGRVSGLFLGVYQFNSASIGSASGLLSRVGPAVEPTDGSCQAALMCPKEASQSAAIFARNSDQELFRFDYAGAGYRSGTASVGQAADRASGGCSTGNRIARTQAGRNEHHLTTPLQADARIRAILARQLDQQIAKITHVPLVATGFRRPLRLPKLIFDFKVAPASYTRARERCREYTREVRKVEIAPITEGRRPGFTIIVVPPEPPTSSATEGPEPH